jgi:hypothetical protein
MVHKASRKSRQKRTTHLFYSKVTARREKNIRCKS